jgi:hypothetical protein
VLGQLAILAKREQRLQHDATARNRLCDLRQYHSRHTFLRYEI